MPSTISRRFMITGLPLLVAGCAVSTVWSSDEEVATARIAGIGAPSLTLITVRNVGSGKGAHTALVINASERVIFDPAGSWRHPQMPERNDVLYGATPALEAYFTSYHARETYYVISQKILVPAAVAEHALTLAKTAGPVRQSLCTRATSTLLSKLSGFESISPVFFPEKLEEKFSKLPNVERIELREDDSDDNRAVLRNPQRVAL